MSKYAIGVYFRTSMDEVEFADGNLCISIVEDAQTRASKPYVDIRDG